MIEPDGSDLGSRERNEIVEFPSPEAFDLSLILPVRDEVECLETLDRELRVTLASMDLRSEIIYVDDHSVDGSSGVLSRIAESAGQYRTRVVTLRRNYGQTAALSAGFDLAEGQVIVPLDSDGQNNPTDIPRLVNKLREGFDVVSGWRRSRKDSIGKTLPSVIANWLISRVAGLRLHDFGCTLKAYRASFLREVRLYGDMHRFIPVYLAHLGARVTELEVDHRQRLGGASKYGGERIIKVVVDLVLIRFMSKYYSRPMHFFGKLGVVFLLIAMALGVLMIVFKAGWLSLVGVEYKASFIETPLPVLSATFLLGTVNAFFFGILCEILIRIHYESVGSTAYKVRAVEDSQKRSV